MHSTRDVGFLFLPRWAHSFACHTSSHLRTAALCSQSAPLTDLIPQRSFCRFHVCRILPFSAYFLQISHFLCDFQPITGFILNKLPRSPYSTDGHDDR